MVTLTEKQASVFAYISRHVRRYGYAPSVMDVAKATGRSKTAAYAIMKRLDQRGAIKRNKYTHRAIELP